MIPNQLDAELLERIRARLAANGMETNRLRVLLMQALIDAARLAGDTGEASAVGEILGRHAQAYRGAATKGGGS